MKFASFIDNNKNTWGIVKDEYLIGVDEAIFARSANAPFSHIPRKIDGSGPRIGN